MAQAVDIPPFARQGLFILTYSQWFSSCKEGFLPDYFIIMEMYKVVTWTAFNAFALKAVQVTTLYISTYESDNLSVSLAVHPS